MPDIPSSFVESTDGTRIALFSSGRGAPLVLVHGTSADHTTFRVVGPMLAAGRRIHAMDRRGRGASGDGPDYHVAREFEDLATVIDRIAGETGGRVDVVGHSFGGRVALGAALRSSAVGRLVVYEGAPPAPGQPYQPGDLRRRLEAVLARRGPAAVYETFLTDVVGMAPAEIEAYRANPVWPDRVAAAPTILRELEAEASAEASLDGLGGVSVPVLQVLGGESREAFRRATEALDARLADGRVVVIEGARHAAHHTHPTRFVAEVESFLTA